MTSSSMPMEVENPPEMITLREEKAHPKEMVVALEVEKILQMSHPPKEIQMARLEGQVVLVAKETALMKALV